MSTETPAPSGTTRPAAESNESREVHKKLRFETEVQMEAERSEFAAEGAV